MFDVFHKTVIGCELKGEDILKANTIGFRVYDHGIVTYLDCLLTTIRFIC